MKLATYLTKYRILYIIMDIITHYCIENEMRA